MNEAFIEKVEEEKADEMEMAAQAHEEDKALKEESGCALILGNLIVYAGQ